VPPNHRLVPIRITVIRVAAAAFLSLSAAAMIVQSAPVRADQSADSQANPNPGPEISKSSESKNSGNQQAEPQHFVAEEQRSTGSVTVEGRTVHYVAFAGTLVVHPKGYNDVPQNAPKDEAQNPRPEASMFYVAYFKVPEGSASAGRGRSGHEASATQDLSAVGSSERPLTFLYNGGPGSSSVWLHMGAFGPHRVVTDDHTQTPPAPYRLVNNDYSLLDASDLVFVDAPGTGFSRIAGKDREKAFYGVDQDAWAYSDFIVQFLSKYGRWNSPKYLFGESYGTTRSAALSYVLESRDINLNGIMLLSQILNFDLSADGPQVNPGIDLPYELALPTYAATAWYHHRLPGPQRELDSLLQEVEQFAMNDYARALEAGTTLAAQERDRIVDKLHEYTGLPEEYIRKANLRVNGGEFEKSLEGTDLTTGRLDTRFLGPSLDPLSEGAEYDPQSAAISSAYVSLFNNYVRKQLHYGQDQLYRPEVEIRNWDFLHQPPGVGMPLQQSTNVMPDLAIAMKEDPLLHVLLNAGYFDLATPFYEGVYELHHLEIPDSLRSNIEFAFYQSGHMVYAHEPALKRMHDNVAAFIHRTQGGAAAQGTQPPQTQ
jgi:carboxypeptidase C (cathepsin A)